MKTTTLLTALLLLSGAAFLVSYAQTANSNPDVVTISSVFSSGSTGQESRAIAGRTQLNIQCVPIPGATGDEINVTKTVNVPAIWMQR